MIDHHHNECELSTISCKCACHHATKISHAPYDVHLTHVHACVACVCVCVCVYCMCMHMCTCACVCVCMPICVCVCVWRVCACLCACVHVHVSLCVSCMQSAMLQMCLCHLDHTVPQCVWCAKQKQNNAPHCPPMCLMCQSSHSARKSCFTTCN